MSLLHPLRFIPFLFLGLSSTAAFALDSERQAEVSRRGAEVMPFSLEATQHQFEKTGRGGIQRVLVRNRANREQIFLIRAHLKDLAARFGRGDYSGPESIHGADMPGLAQLRGAPKGRLKIRYREEPAGASLRYTSYDPRLVAALHDWFDAQVSDHGHDAMAIHHHHHPQGNPE